MTRPDPGDAHEGTLEPFGSSKSVLAKNEKYKVGMTTGATDVAGNPLDQTPTTSGTSRRRGTSSPDEA